ncbi:3-oxo-5-alpha-steroid 4-dehydrogenase 1 isoform X1 [Panthera tigris]|uniref:3-oxo-5-alpha-steroid 4-dehydrogenase 1 isoform X1 n=1 Tax=Panthera tigris TaxID=9694 RepID=UPI001C6F68BC|nr:3-oxo-5-alpha-steroid 4-dehydrogenase 1 isoform X1 [Panthera tigris]
MEPAEGSHLDALAYLECALGLLGSVLLKLVRSAYGRYASPRPACRVPARAAWALQELPSLAVPLWVCARTAAERLRHAPNRVLLAMFLVHYAQRSRFFSNRRFPVCRGQRGGDLLVLSCQPLVWSPGGAQVSSRTTHRFAVRSRNKLSHPPPCVPSTKGPLPCLRGTRARWSLIFPLLIRGGKPMPLYTCTLAFMFCVYNGYLQSRYLSQYAVYADDWVTDPRFLLGFCLWLIGMLINIHSDHILRNLRKPGETGYKIPRGGLFEYVTAANYFGEVVEWCGYALASWSVQGGAFAAFTFCILVSRAQQHHQWYLEKFEDYPKFRKIIIPFLL